MVQFSIIPGGSLPVLESAVAGAARFAEAVRSTPNARSVSSQSGSVTVANDRQHVLATGAISAEVSARSAGIRNGATAVSLLQTADSALAEIGLRLDQMASLADAASSSGLSDLERAQLDTGFQALKAEIDTIAEQTTFNGTPLLQGGDGPDGALEISFKIGSGSGAEDTITVTIAPASVADLSADLDSGGIQTLSAAETAASSIETAQDAVNSIRASVAGDGQRFLAAARNSQAVTTGLEDAQAVLSAPTISVDMAQLLATRVAEEGGIELTNRGIERIQQLLIGLELPGADQNKQDDALAPAGGAASSAAPAQGDRQTAGNTVGYNVDFSDPDQTGT